MNKSWIWKEHKYSIVNGIAGVLLLAILTIAIYGGLSSGVFLYKAGDIANGDIVLPGPVVDQVATDLLKQSVSESIPDSTYTDVNMQITVRSNLTNFFDSLENTKEVYQVEADMLQRIFAQIEKENTLSLNKEELQSLVVLPMESITRMRRTIVDVVSEYMSQGITVENLAAQQENVKKYVSLLEEYTEQERFLMQRVLEGSLKVNAFIDLEATHTARMEAQNNVEDVIVPKGTVLVDKGQVVTEGDIRLMTDSGVTVSTMVDVYRQWGFAFFMGLLIVGLTYLLAQMCEEVSFKKEYHGAIIAILIALMTAFAMFVSPVSPMLVPVGLIVIVLSLLFSTKLALYLLLPVILAIGLAGGFSTYAYGIQAIIYLVVALMAIGVNQRMRIYRIGVFIMLMYIAVELGNSFINQTGFSTEWVEYLYPLLNGLICAALSVGILPVFEHVFNVLTPIRLLELGNPNHPLLKRLLFEAPGTYHHSILVSNLADAAATSINANALLVRTAAFYHDVGKLDRPYYFQENILSKENPHERLTAVMSASIIKEHPKRGVAIMSEYKFPKELTNLVVEHHGTTLIRYFYHTAMNSTDDVAVSDFTYEGPAPSSKESAILMLADSCEAAVRSIDEHSVAEISKMINRVVKQKLEEGQFLNTSLTFKDLELIKGAFMKVFEGIYHTRISYPEDKK